jgi:hypothetical protein
MKSTRVYLSIFLLSGPLFHLSCKKELSCENCATGNANKPPTAIAGPDQVITLPTDSVLLNGMISDYLWTKISAPLLLISIIHRKQVQ